MTVAGINNSQHFSPRVFSRLDQPLPQRRSSPSVWKCSISLNCLQRTVCRSIDGLVCPAAVGTKCGESGMQKQRFCLPALTQGELAFARSFLWTCSLIFSAVHWTVGLVFLFEWTDLAMITSLQSIWPVLAQNYTKKCFFDSFSCFSSSISTALSPHLKSFNLSSYFHILCNHHPAISEAAGRL